jgi:general stress protein YciG
MNKPHIYKITNNVNGKYYYGVHNGSNTEKYMGSGKLLKKAYDKYGKDPFSKEILLWFDTIDEAVIVNEKQINNQMCYNIHLGGCGGSQKGRPDLSKDKRKRMANNLPEKTKTFQSKAGKAGGKARILKQSETERSDIAKKGAKATLDKNPNHMKEIGKKGIEQQVKSGKHMNNKKVECPYGCGYINNPGNVGKHKKKCDLKD